MKIILLTLEYPPHYGGVASYYVGLVEELKRQGNEVDVLSQGLLSCWIWPRWLKAYFLVRKLTHRGSTSVNFATSVNFNGDVYNARKVMITVTP